MALFREDKISVSFQYRMWERGKDIRISDTSIQKERRGETKETQSHRSIVIVKARGQDTGNCNFLGDSGESMNGSILRKDQFWP